jgi:hypothetical protein
MRRKVEKSRQKLETESVHLSNRHWQSTIDNPQISFKSQIHFTRPIRLLARPSRSRLLMFDGPPIASSCTAGGMSVIASALCRSRPLVAGADIQRIIFVSTDTGRLLAFARHGAMVSADGLTEPTRIERRKR